MHVPVSMQGAVAAGVVDLVLSAGQQTSARCSHLAVDPGGDEEGDVLVMVEPHRDVVTLSLVDHVQQSVGALLADLTECPEEPRDLLDAICNLGARMDCHA